MSHALPPLVLASTSPIRASLLASLGVPYQAVPPRFQEEDGGGDPVQEALYRGRAKAESVRERFPDAVIIGSDQVMCFQGRLVPKPRTNEEAARLLMALRGKEHTLSTSVVVLTPRRVALARVVVSRLVVHPDLSDEEIWLYVAADRPAGCAGGYKIEEHGMCLFARIRTPDHTAIMGLPLLSLGRCLRRLGFRVRGFSASALAGE